MPIMVARFGSTTDVGLAELMLAVFYVITPFVEAGSTAAVIQRVDLTERFLATVLLVNAMTGVTTATMLWLGSSPLIRFAGFDPRLGPLIVGLSPCLAVFGLAVVPQSLLARRMSFGIITTLNTVAVAMSVASTMIGATRGLGARSVVVALQVYAITNAAGAWLFARWVPRGRPDRDELRRLLRFSLPTVGARLVGDFAAQFERFLIGGGLGSAILGLYGVSRNLARTPFLQLMQVTDRVLLPAWSSL